MFFHYKVVKRRFNKNTKTITPRVVVRLKFGEGVVAGWLTCSVQRSLAGGRNYGSRR